MARKITDIDVSLSDITGVDLSGAQEGHALVRSDGLWISAAPSAGGEEVLPDQFKGTLDDGGIYLGRNKVEQSPVRLTNVGSKWVARGDTRNWKSVAVSSDGKYQTSGLENGLILISSDYGQTWAEAPNGNIVGNWWALKMSSDGKYQTAVANKGKIYISSDYGQTWAEAPGQAVNRNWKGLDMSSNGKYQTAVVNGGKIYISSDYGQTWAEAPGQAVNRDWDAVAMSSDGKYQTAVAYNGQIYTSSDFGATWTPVGTSNYWTGVAMSSDGKYQTAILGGSAALIYISSDFGQTWILAPNGNDPNNFWRVISMSSSGKYQTVASGSTGLPIYISSDYGQSWVEAADVTTLSSWRGIAMSSDGKIQIIVPYNGQIHFSIADTIIDGGLIVPTAKVENIPASDVGLSSGDLYYIEDGGIKYVYVKE